jgi:hypothetical protein
LVYPVCTVGILRFIFYFLSTWSIEANDKYFCRGWLGAKEEFLVHLLENHENETGDNIKEESRSRY